jgi:hypothetical protein
VEYFCAAKPQKCDLKPVQWSEAERCCNALLSEALLCKKVNNARLKPFLAKHQPKFPQQDKPKKQKSDITQNKA